jgi:hypothetical protein
MSGEKNSKFRNVLRKNAFEPFSPHSQLKEQKVAFSPFDISLQISIDKSVKTLHNEPPILRTVVTGLPDGLFSNQKSQFG